MTVEGVIFSTTAPEEFAQAVIRTNKLLRVFKTVVVDCEFISTNTTRDGFPIYVLFILAVALVRAEVLIVISKVVETCTVVLATMHTGDDLACNALAVSPRMVDLYPSVVFELAAACWTCYARTITAGLVLTHALVSPKARSGLHPGRFLRQHRALLGEYTP